MTTTRLITGLAQLAPDYDLLFCDVWGVIHNGREAFADATDALARFRADGGAVVLVTNAPVPEHRVVSVMERLGVPATAYDRVATSGDATRRELSRRGGPIYTIGVDGDTSVYDGLNLDLTLSPEEASVICCTSLRDYPNDEPGRYEDELKRLATTGLEMICANPDVQFKHGDRLIWSAGSLAQMYEQLGGAVVRPGKPGRPIYDLAREEAAALGRTFTTGRTLAIGDGPETDIQGALNEGVDSLFIGGGIHGHRLDNSEQFEIAAGEILREQGVRADYLAPALRW